jgi:hypothetical protein
MFAAFFPSTADQTAWDPPQIQSLHTMGRCLGAAADTTKNGIRFNEQLYHSGASNECGGFSCFEAFGLGCSLALASHMHLCLKLPLRMETVKAIGRSKGSESIRYIDNTIPPCSGCSWGSLAGIEWTIPQLTINAAGRCIVRHTTIWLRELKQFTRDSCCYLNQWPFLFIHERLLHLQSACFTRS